jgi:CubicO group peptidase (beta-lactamase class C family)
VWIARLLRHQSGIAAWTPLWLRLGKSLGDVAALADLLLRADSRLAPAGTASSGGLAEATDPRPLFESRGPGRDEGAAADDAGKKSLYSDLGFVLFGLAAEKATGQSLAELLDSNVCAPLGVAPLGALSAAPPDPVECRLDNGKEVELAAEQGLRLAPQRSFHLGVPQDGNARAMRAMGRLAGHAGLFVTADEMLALGREWLAPSRLLSPAARDGALAGGGAYALGWARWSADGSGGAALSSSSFGHTGFTGGSLWIDPERGRIHVLLAHRLASRLDFNPFRREFHRLAAALG